MAFETALQAGIYTRLSGLLSVPVHDDVPAGDADGTGAPFPYVTIGEDTLAGWDSFTSDGAEATITIHVWSRARGRKEVKQVQGEIYDALHRQPVAIAGFDLVSCLFEQSVSMLDPDGITRHGVQVFRVIFDRDRP